VVKRIGHVSITLPEQAVDLKVAFMGTTAAVAAKRRQLVEDAFRESFKRSLTQPPEYSPCS
jgi:hypothetical protein